MTSLPYAAPIFNLDEDIIMNISTFLSPKDLRSSLCVNKSWRDVQKSPVFFKGLLPDSPSFQKTQAFTSFSLSQPSNKNDSEETLADHYKRIYFLCDDIYSPSLVSWRKIDHGDHIPSARFGHAMCRFRGPNNRQVVLTGGYVEDAKVYVLNVPRLKSEVSKTKAQAATRRREKEQVSQFVPVEASGQVIPQVHGATLTSIDGERSILFGGFDVHHGIPTNDMYLLSVKNDNGLKATWQRINPKGEHPRPRGYHTATLLCNRFLVVIGGMQTDKSIMDVDIFDIKSWKWQTGMFVSYHDNIGPVGRGGHSIIHDAARNRLVMFGGSTQDSSVIWDGTKAGPTEVWELQLGSNKSKKGPTGKRKSEESDTQQGNNLSFPWKWNRINFQSMDAPLEFGHNAIQTSIDSILFSFGATRNMCFGPQPMVKFCLAHDRFDVSLVSSAGFSPQQRSLAACVGFPEDGFAIVHGGRSCAHLDTWGDALVLDIAQFANKQMNLPLFSDD